MASRCCSLPVIDLCRAHTDRQMLAEELVSALETVGFVSVINIPGFNPQQLLALTKDFFRLDDQVKWSITKCPFNSESTNCYRGYFPAKTTEGDASYKNGYDMGHELTPDDPDLGLSVLYEKTPWPQGLDNEKDFKEPLLQYFCTMDSCGKELLRLVALGLGVKEDIFDAQFGRNPLSTLRLLHYPPRLNDHKVPAVARDGELLLHCGDHQDGGFLTLLATFHYAGLQVNTEGVWRDVIVKPDSLVMNIGKVLEAMTGNRLKATRHRVIDLGIERYSVPYFMEPHYYAKLSPVIQEATTLPVDGCDWDEDKVKLSTGEKTVYYGPWIIQRMQRKYVEFQNLSNFLKS